MNIVGGLFNTTAIRPEIKLLSAILLPKSESYIEDEIFSELNGVTLSQALYEALGEVSLEACRRPRFAPKVQEIMANRYGLLNGQGRLLRDVGKSFGMTRQGIFVIERLALEYLRLPKYRDKLLLYVRTKKSE